MGFVCEPLYINPETSRNSSDSREALLLERELFFFSTGAKAFLGESLLQIARSTKHLCEDVLIFTRGSRTFHKTMNPETFQHQADSG